MERSRIVVLIGIFLVLIPREKMMLGSTFWVMLKISFVNLFKNFQAHLATVQSRKECLELETVSGQYLQIASSGSPDLKDCLSGDQFCLRKTFRMKVEEWGREHLFDTFLIASIHSFSSKG